MQKQYYIKTLRKLGLSKNEALVYFTTLSLGSTTIITIAQKSGMRRTTVYTVIESLEQKGLVYKELSGMKTLFVAHHPNQLAKILEERKSDLDMILPELSALHNTDNKNKIKQYIGIDSIKSVYDSILKETKPGEFYYILSNTQNFLRADPKYFKSFIEKRSALRADLRLLLHDSEEAQYFKKYEQNFAAQIKVLPKESSFSSSFSLTPHVYILHQMVDPISVLVIENKSIIEMQKEFFEVAWNSIKEK